MRQANLYLGDCVEVLRTIDTSTIDAIVADPAYGMAAIRSNAHHWGGGDKSRFDPIIGDDHPFDPSPWLDFPHVILWGANHYAQRLPVGTTLVWIKKYDDAFGTFLSDAEIGWQKGGHGVYCHREAGGNVSREREGINGVAAHPTQKPLSLMGWCIERLKLPKGSTVCDPYMGSGSTGIAALRLGMNFLGIERDPKHFAIAEKRIRNDAPMFNNVSVLGR